VNRPLLSANWPKVIDDGLAAEAELRPPSQRDTGFRHAFKTRGNARLILSENVR
jgi:hypothetical protein